MCHLPKLSADHNAFRAVIILLLQLLLLLSSNSRGFAVHLFCFDSHFRCGSLSSEAVWLLSCFVFAFVLLHVHFVSFRRHELCFVYMCGVIVSSVQLFTMRCGVKVFCGEFLCILLTFVVFCFAVMNLNLTTNSVCITTNCKYCEITVFVV